VNNVSYGTPMGTTKEFYNKIPIPMPGQAFAWDPSDEKILYGIDRKSKEVIVVEIKIPPR
jgi:hypothetical protein